MSSRSFTRNCSPVCYGAGLSEAQLLKKTEALDDNKDNSAKRKKILHQRWIMTARTVFPFIKHQWSAILQEELHLHLLVRSASFKVSNAEVLQNSDGKNNFFLIHFLKCSLNSTGTWTLIIMRINMPFDSKRQILIILDSLSNQYLLYQPPQAVCDMLNFQGITALLYRRKYQWKDHLFALGSKALTFCSF